MSIRDSHIDEHTKNITVEMEVNNFSDVGYWLRTIKLKLKDFRVLKIKVNVNITYFDDGIPKKDQIY